MTLRKGDYIFLIVYIVILFSLLLITPAIVEETGSNVVEKSTPIWINTFLILLYAIVVPIIYFLIRKYLNQRKESV